MSAWHWVRYTSGVILVSAGMASCTAAPLSITCASILALQPAMAPSDTLTLLGTPDLMLPLAQCRYRRPAHSGECWFYRVDPPRNRMALEVVFVDGALVEAALERVELLADENTVLFRTTAEGVVEAGVFQELLACDRRAVRGPTRTSASE